MIFSLLFPKSVLLFVWKQPANEKQSRVQTNSVSTACCFFYTSQNSPSFGILGTPLGTATSSVVVTSGGKCNKKKTTFMMTLTTSNTLIKKLVFIRRQFKLQPDRRAEHGTGCDQKTKCPGEKAIRVKFIADQSPERKEAPYP